MNLGILIFGGNHLVLRGPSPTDDQAREMVRHWSLIQLGRPPGTTFGQWTISTREFRENLSWAFAVAGPGERTAAVEQLLGELAARGVELREG
jgi:hypothetical protein